MQTYWAELQDGTASGKSDSEETASQCAAELSVAPENEIGHHVERSTQLLAGFLKAMIARRRSLGIQGDSAADLALAEETCSEKTGYFLDEVQETIGFPEVASRRDTDLTAEDDLNEAVRSQLHSYVLTLASLHQQNSFHNFEHATHVAASVDTLLAELSSQEHGEVVQDGIKTRLGSNPLIKFACVFSALVHCADHQGIPNSQLVRESAALAQVYRRKNVIEQNALEIGWRLLMTDSFADLRRAIYTNEEEFNLFRQLIVNCVVSTDIFDKAGNARRKSRWDRTFTASSTGDSSSTSTNAKATQILEHLMQVSSAVHTMRQWPVYSSWNSRLFEEAHLAWQQCRSLYDPSETWFESELGLFDFVIIPMAQKLKDCGMFGAAGNSYLQFALSNRQQMHAQGKALVNEMISQVKTK